MDSESSITGSGLQDENSIDRADGNKRAWLLYAVRHALVAAARAESHSKGVPVQTQQFRANGLEAVDRHLARLLAAARQPGAPQVGQALEGICDGCRGCPQSSMVCPLRSCGTCIVLCDCDTILDAIAKALWAVKDPQYVQSHPMGPGR